MVGMETFYCRYEGTQTTVTADEAGDRVVAQFFREAGDHFGWADAEAFIASQNGILIDIT